MGSDEPEQYRKLFIGGLNYTTTNDSLKEFFEQWGEIVDVVVMKDPQTKRSRGFGFITYSQSSMVDQAMSNRPHKIDGREVETKRAVPRDDIDKPDIAATVKKMFVSGIKEQSENDLHEYFGKFGNITNVTIVTDKDSGQRKGFGFIEYDDTDSVDKAVLIKSHQVAGGKLDVKKAISRSDGAGGGRGGRGGRGGGGGGGGNRSSWGGNPRNEQWGGHHNRSNGGGGGYGNSGMGGGYGSGGGGGGGYGGSAGGYNSNSGGAWQGGGGAPQSWGNNNPAWGNQGGGGDSWGGSQQPSNNWGPNQSYGGGGGPMRSNYTSNNRATPYGNPGRAGNVNAGNAGYGQNPGRRY
ncbi:heterogeneous nuclear ribonucleoprotein 87F-like isoform X1 [Rhopalosiphum padi]|uniref:heterogeneous nuclear ribonucleoprotein 87F-like isoform X1 n=1 Tax=Rhopalosiphum padi TaxID=40932 RepID=UPI00298D835A|nr:heterogeneous nuclear ribonucleoprotein 87F-like isoform X1 [Rhopalosiphum padi]